METSENLLNSGSDSIIIKKANIPKTKDLITDSWFWYIKNFKDIFSIFFIPAILMIPLGFFEAINSKPNLGDNLVIVVIFIGVLSLVQFIINIISTVGLVKRIPDFDKSRQNWVDVYRDGLNLFWGIALVISLQLLATLTGFVLFIIPGIIISFYLLFTIYTFVLDNRKGFDALVYSFHFVRYNIFGIAVRLIALGILTIILIYLLMITLTLGTVFLPTSFSKLIVISANSFIQIIFLTPFIVFYNYKIFKSLKSGSDVLDEDRKEIYRKRFRNLSIAGGFIVIGIIVLKIIF